MSDPAANPATSGVSDAVEVPVTAGGTETESATPPTQQSRESTRHDLLAGKFPPSATNAASPFAAAQMSANDVSQQVSARESKNTAVDSIPPEASETAGNNTKNTDAVRIPVNDDDDDESQRVSDVISNLSRRLGNRVTSFGEPLSVPQLTAIQGGETEVEEVDLLDYKDGKTRAEPILATSVDPWDDSFDLASYVKHKNALHESHGFRIPPIAITYENLSVWGDPVSKEYIPDFFRPLTEIFMPSFLKHYFIKHYTNKQLEYTHLIHETSGFVLPGEMTLVLGRPGSGCSSFLRTLAGITRGLTSIDGDIRYNGIAQKDFLRDYPSYTAYNAEADIHQPTLTVRQTLRFVLECRLGGAVEGRRRKMIEDEIQVFLRTFGLLGAAETKVGDEMVRGCSGGEKKRVSICEQLCAGASLGFWDGSTRGLDSSTALDFIRSLKVLSGLTRTAQVVTLYQASEDIYNLFDKVVVVDQSRVIYFGPTDRAKQHFLDLGFSCPSRKVTPDFLTGIAVNKERNIEPGFEDKVPNQIEEYEQAYLKSQVYKDMESIRRETNEIIGQRDTPKMFNDIISKNKTVLGRADVIKSRYSTTVWQQFKACCKREWLLASTDMSTRGVLVFDVIMSIVVGGVFFNVSNDYAGAFARGGAIFFSILYNCFNALASVNLIIRGRTVAAKHHSYHLYRTYMQPFCAQITNLPFSLVTMILWSCANYWMVGLRANASAFFTFIVFIFGANQAFGGIVRTLASAAPDINIAMMANNVILLVFVVYAGYIVPYPSMLGWASWIYWINPLAYAIKSLLQNEFEGITISCKGSTVPVGGAYDSLPDANRACAIAGSTPGSTSVPGSAYLRAYMNAGTYGKWYNFMANVGFMIIIICSLLLVAKFITHFPVSYTVNAWKPRRKQKYDANAKSTSMDNIDFTITDSCGFSWKNINYTIELPNGEKRQLLHNVSGLVRSGHLVALMGASGAGKTTLIDCLTQRKTIGELNGQIYVATSPQDETFKSITAYCEQLDVHNERSTIREAIRFAAKLKQPKEVPLEKRYEFAEQVIDLLELRPIADAIIGSSSSRLGTSVEEQKRITIACELVARPKILFLDEPTSGLDSQASFTIVRLLRKLADCGQAILCTIHQPSAVLFEQFDSLLLLARGGRTIYHGELGQDAATLRTYFEKNGAKPCSPTANVAEYMLDVIGAGTIAQKSTIDWVSVWENSEERVKMLQDIDELRGCTDENAVALKGTNYDRLIFKSSFWDQLSSVFTRMVRTHWRNPSYNFGRVVTQLITSLFIGFTFFQTDNTSTGIQNKVFAIFMSTIVNSLQLNLVQPNYIEMRRVFIREESSGVYDWKAFAISVVASEWVWCNLGSTVFFIVFYYLVGLNHDSDRAIYFWLMLCIFGMYAVSLGQAIASALPTVQFCGSINPIFFSILNLLCGVTLPVTSMPKFWHWVYHVDSFHYLIEGLIGNELGGAQISCADSAGYPLQAPDGVTCGDYMADFFSGGGFGILSNSSATGTCHYCPYATGDQYLATLGWKASHKWRNYSLMYAYFAFNLVVLAMICRVYRVGR